jgi:hypothetical protein
MNEIADVLREASRRWKETGYPVPLVSPRKSAGPRMDVQIPKQAESSPCKGLKREPNGKPKT